VVVTGMVAGRRIPVSEREGEFEMKKIDLARYTVSVPHGVSISDAIAAHRESTGHNEGVFLVLGAGPNASRRARRSGVMGAGASI
jgi:hypothetical protein